MKYENLWLTQWFFFHILSNLNMFTLCEQKSIVHLMKRKVWKKKRSQNILGTLRKRKSSQKDIYVLKLDTFNFFPWGKKSMSAADPIRNFSSSSAGQFNANLRHELTIGSYNKQTLCFQFLSQHLFQIKAFNLHNRSVEKELILSSFYR